MTIMEQEQYIKISEFCRGHALEESFLFRLEEYALIRIVEFRQQAFFPKEELPRVERMIRLHRDFQIGPEGLQAVDHLLERMQRMQQEMIEMRRRLERFE